MRIDVLEQFLSLRRALAHTLVLPFLAVDEPTAYSAGFDDVDIERERVGVSMCVLKFHHRGSSLVVSSANCVDKPLRSMNSSSAIRIAYLENERKQMRATRSSHLLICVNNSRSRSFRKSQSTRQLTKKARSVATKIERVTDTSVANFSFSL